MQDYNEHIARLFTKRFFNKKMTVEETSQLEEWIAQSPLNKQAFEEAMDTNILLNDLKECFRFERELGLEQTIDLYSRSAKTFKLFSFSINLKTASILVTIVALTMLALIGYFIYDKKSSKNLALSSTREKIPVSQIPSSPKGISPTLSLINDSIIYLQNTGDTLSVFKNGMYDGEKYIPIHANQSTGERVYNTLSVPRSSNKPYYKSLKLPDSSYVFLSQGASLRFPAEFTGNERKVILTGEGYFEVTHNSDLPFKVVVASSFGQQNNIEIVVTGTRFIIDAPANKKYITTTLVYGSVIIKSNYGQKTIIEGQQAELNEDNSGYVVSEIDVIDYQNRGRGITRFKNASISAILSMLKKFHNIEGKYDTNCSTLLNGFINQTTTLDRTLKSLNEMSSKLNWKLNNDTIEVSCITPH